MFPYLSASLVNRSLPKRYPTKYIASITPIVSILIPLLAIYGVRKIYSEEPPNESKILAITASLYLVFPMFFCVHDPHSPFRFFLS